MDLRDAAIHALTTAQTERQALDLLITAHPMSVYEARVALGQAVADLGWALLVAPELYLCLSAWWRVQRIADDLEVARDTRDRLAKGLAEPRVMVVVETRTGKVVARPEGLIGETKVGPDLLSVRSKALFDGSNTIFKGEDALARAELAFQAAVARYQRSLKKFRDMPPQQQAAELMQITYVEGHHEVARALLTFKAEGGDPASAATDEQLQAELLTLRKQQESG